MEAKKRCQSCGMPLLDPRFSGTEVDGSRSQEYCQMCYQKGAFTEPNLTADAMVARSIGFMSKKLSYSAEEASRLSNEIIPKLKRWTNG